MTAKEIQLEIVRKNTAQLTRAHDMLAELEAKEEHAARVQRLGFVKSRDTAALGALETARATVELHEHYARKYPGLKFIEAGVMREVCTKYGLVLGQPDRYKGTVPVWAAKAIEANMHLVRAYRPLRSRWGRLVKEKVPFSSEPLVGEVVWTAKGAALVQRDRYDAMKAMPFADPSKLHDVGQTYTPVAPDHAVLMIAAPVDEMDLRWYERVESGRIVVKDDPIVCLHVKHGYVVLAAWGPEGQDPAVFNVGLN